MKVTVDRELCTGHARCVVAGPTFYSLDDEGFNSLRDTAEVAVPPGLEAEARAGSDACPECAITLTDE